MNRTVTITIEAYGQKQVLETWSDLTVHRPPHDPERAEQEDLIGTEIYETLDRMLEASKP